MNRWAWLAVVLMAGGATNVVAAPPVERWNVLFIIADDLNCQLGCYDRPEVHSPHIDRLASRGVRFQRSYCQYALCNPSRASFLSGRRPQTTGIINQALAVRDKLPNAVLLPQLFRENGWYTAGIGKVFHSPKLSDPKSWDVYEHTGSQDPGELEAIKRRYANPAGQRTPDWMILDGSGDQTMDARTAQRIVGLLEEQAKKGKPFFLVAGFQKPHLPWAVPRKYFDQYAAGKIVLPKEPLLRAIPAVALMTELTPSPPPASRQEAIAAYYASISFMDAQVGLLLSALDRLKLWDNTVVVFVGDNGFHLGDHGGLWSKETNFEQAARVPLIVAAPNCQRGKSCSRTVELINLYPTLQELCGLPSPEGLEGSSLVPLLKQPDAPWTRPAFTMALHRGIRGQSVRTERWRYTTWDDDKQSAELYDHENDPGEYTNLAGNDSHAQHIRELRQLLKH